MTKENSARDFDRRRIVGLVTADFSGPYLRMVNPCDVVKPYYMLGDHGPFCPIQFR